MTNLNKNEIALKAIESAKAFLKQNVNEKHVQSSKEAIARHTIKSVKGQAGSLYKRYRFSCRVKVSGFCGENYKNWLRLPKIVGEIEMESGDKYRVGVIKVENKYRSTLHPKNKSGFCADIL